MAKGVGGKRKLKFKTTKRENATKRRKLILGFVAIVLVLAIASAVTYIKERKDKTDEDTSDSELSTLVQTKMKENVSLLFAGTSTSENKPLFATVIKFNTKDSTITVTPLSTAEINGEKTQELVSGFSEKAGMTFDRYIVVNEKNFKSFVGLLGTYETEIGQAIDYKGDDFSLSLLSGKQKLTGDKLFKYVRYLGADGSDYSLENQGKLIADFLSQKLNETNTSKGEDLFSSMVNLSESDITIVDFSKYKDWLAEISKKPRNVTVELK